MFEVSCMNAHGIRLYYRFNTYFAACVCAMGLSEHSEESMGMADVVDAETGEVIRIYHWGMVTYLAEGWD